MLTRIREFFETSITMLGTDETAAAKTIELAAAVLMVEISLADSELHPEERKVIERALRDDFHMDDNSVQELIAAAGDEVDHAVSLYEFTRLLNDSMEYGDKIRIVELLWRVAYADAVLDKYEEYYVRKVSDLLYVSHKDYIQAKHRAASD